MFRKLATALALNILATCALSIPLKAQDAATGASDNPLAVSKFFDQLRQIFGKFSQADLQEVFQAADPIRCPELVQGKGEWKPVAFFNDNRELGAWYHQTLEEVKTDLRAYVFKGVCTTVRSTVQLTTKFPVKESIQLFNSHEIRFQDIEVNVNAPVDAAFNPQLQSFSFTLPYMFLREYHDTARLYTLNPQKIAERENYEPDVIDRWDCKAVHEQDVTYQFMICRAVLTTVTAQRRGQRRVPFGSAGYVILSDGKEGRANVRFTFGDSDTPKPPRP